MKHTVVIGAQWGDEGKGKLVDALAQKFDVVVRFNGGNNAGHTVIYEGEACKLHSLPSGIFHKKKLVIAQGAVFDPEVLLTEIDFCKKHKLPLDLLIDYRVHLVMPYHKLMDVANESWKGKKATGSVKAGIGYCYEDRNNRVGIRCEDLLYPKFLAEKIETIFLLKKKILENVYNTKVTTTSAAIIKRTQEIAKLLKPFIADATVYLDKTKGTKKILFEGANGSMLDGHFGTYPFTVANPTQVNSLFGDIGVVPFPLDVIGVVKAYTTRVGNGPFPTEQVNQDGVTMQTVGKEIGSTSGRVRRCGWLDLPQLRYSQRMNGFTQLMITKLDVLSAFSEILVCTHYMFNGKKLTEFPSISHHITHCKPVYTKLPGWKTPLAGIKTFSKLPKAAQNYSIYIEKSLKVPVTTISVGPGRNDLLRRPD